MASFETKSPGSLSGGVLESDSGNKVDVGPPPFLVCVTQSKLSCSSSSRSSRTLHPFASSTRIQKATLIKRTESGAVDANPDFLDCER